MSELKNQAMHDLKVKFVKRLGAAKETEKRKKKPVISCVKIQNSE